MEDDFQYSLDTFDEISPEEMLEKDEIYGIDMYERAIAKYGLNNLVLAGASSGEGTVLALCQYASTHGLKQSIQVMLLFPWVDVSMTNPDCDKITSAQAGPVDRGSLEYRGARYTRDKDFVDYDTGIKKYQVNECVGPGIKYAFASPIHGSFNGLKSDYFVYTGDYEYCMTDTVKAVEKLQAAGTNMTLHKYQRTVHGYMFESTRYQTETIIDIAENIMTERGAQELD